MTDEGMSLIFDRLATIEANLRAELAAVHLALQTALLGAGQAA